MLTAHRDTCGEAGRRAPPTNRPGRSRSPSPEAKSGRDPAHASSDELESSAKFPRRDQGPDSRLLAEVTGIEPESGDVALCHLVSTCAGQGACSSHVASSRCCLVSTCADFCDQSVTILPPTINDPETVRGDVEGGLVLRKPIMAASHCCAAGPGAGRSPTGADNCDWLFETRGCARFGLAVILQRSSIVLIFRSDSGRLRQLRNGCARQRRPAKPGCIGAGHADVGVTLKVYAHVLPGDDEEAALRADSLLAP